MEELNSLMHGFAVVLTPMNLGLMVLGIVLGVLIGVLPGLGAAEQRTPVDAGEHHDGRGR